MTNFQIILTGFFVFFIVAGVILFANFKGNKSGSIIGNVVIWGTVDKGVFNNVLDDLRNQNDSLKNVSYKQIEKNNFDATLTEAMASGKGPDIFILPQKSILKHQDKIVSIPYKTYPERNFKNKFIEEGEMYLSKSGILAFPFIVDPLVMYWNRDIFSSAGISNPPKFWEDFFSLAQKITRKDNHLNILTSAISFGGFENITNSKSLISSLIMQAGDPVTKKNGLKVESVLGENLDNLYPAEEAIDFYTQFSNPVKPVYTWNLSLPDSKDFFLSGNLAVYFGFASEINDLRRKNPNLNFDVTTIPQIKKSHNKITFGKMYAFAIAKNSKNIKGAFQTVMLLTSNKALSLFSSLSGLPPVSRALLGNNPSNPYSVIFNNSAIISHAWLDPNPKKTSLIFQKMIESIVSGKFTVKNSVQRAGSEIGELIN